MSDVHFPPSATSTALPEAREESDGQVRRHLHGIPDIRGFFRTNTAPVYFVGPTAFNLLGLDRWVRDFHYIAYYDSWDGAHPRVFTPKTSRTSSSRAARRSTTTCCATPRSRRSCRARGGPAEGGDGLLRRGDRADLRRSSATT